MSHRWYVLLGLVYLGGGALLFGEGSSRWGELDAFWKEVSRTVQEGDFEGYGATCHPEAVLVSGSKRTSYPIGQALAGWKQGFLDTKTGKIRASVEFRFSQRLGDETTAHETGIFLSAVTDAEGKTMKSYIEFEALLIKKDRWMILMEYQKAKTNEAEWEKLR